MKHGFTYNELFDIAIEKPSFAQVELTTNCNQKCVFCLRGNAITSNNEDLPIGTWLKIIKKMHSIGIRMINFTGGEVILYKNFIDVLLLCKELGIYTSVNTNGTIDLQNFYGIIDEVIFSIHGISKLHDDIIGLSGAFNMVSDNLNKSIDHFSKVGINTTVIKSNFDHVMDMINHLKKYRCHYHCINIAIPVNSSGIFVEINQDTMSKYFRMIDHTKQIYGYEILKLGMQNIYYSYEEFFTGEIPLPHCAAGKYKIVVDFKGDVYPCCYFQTDDFRCGNIIKENISEIWKSGKGFQIFREIIRQEKFSKTCLTCKKIKRCAGSCAAWRFYTNKKGVDSCDRDPRCKAGNAYSGNRNHIEM